MAPGDFEAVKKAFDDEGLVYTVAEVSMVPQNTVQLEGKKAEQMLNLMEALEDSDDVNHVYANFDISDEVMEAFGIGPSRLIGDIKHALEDAVEAGEIEARREGAYYVEFIASNRARFGL